MAKYEGEIPAGMELLYALDGHDDAVLSLAWSPDGKRLVSASEQRVCIWDAEKGSLIRTIEFASKITQVIVTSDNQRIATISSKTPSTWLIDSWNPQNGAHIKRDQHTCISLSSQPLSSTQTAIFRLRRNKRGESYELTIKNLNDNSPILTIESSDNIIEAQITPDTSTLAYITSTTSHRDIHSPSGITCHIHNINTDNEALFFLGAHSSSNVNALKLAHGFAFVGIGPTILVADLGSPSIKASVEGHTGAVSSISTSADGIFLCSRSEDDGIRLWRTDTWKQLASVKRTIPHASDIFHFSSQISFHPDQPILAATIDTIAHPHRLICIWRLDPAALLAVPTKRSVFYTTAKIALVGDSGVGKSGLGYRVAEGQFRVTESTHGQQFWVVEELGKTRADGTKCEAVVWDFAGQPDFRPIHSLFLDDVDLALVLFDPSRQDTFTGVDYWLKQLAHKKQLCRTVLVVARTDVSKLSVTRQELEAFCEERGITGGFVATSAKTGTGLEELLDVIRQQIDWDAKPATVTTETFKRIKDDVAALKADAERKSVLVSPAELRALLQTADPSFLFSNEEMMTAVGHLQNHGYVTILRRSAEEQRILLAPDLLINLAASIMLRAQANEKGLGALDEASVLRDDYQFQQVQGLAPAERDALLTAATELFLTRNVCFREAIDDRTFLIFPSLILERPPRLAEEPRLVEDMTYLVTGAIENVYPALAVLLGYSPSFRRTNQWRRQAQYMTVRDEVCGFRQVNDEPTELELLLYYGTDTPEFVRARFRGLFEEILYTRDVVVTRFPPVVCACGVRQERSTVIRRMRQKKPFLNCEECGERVALPSVDGGTALSRENRAGVERDQAIGRMRTTYETALVRVKSALIRDRKGDPSPSCFISYATGDAAHLRWVAQLAEDLRNSDVEVVLDQWHSAAVGLSVSRFISRIEEVRFVVVVGTRAYRKKYENEVSPRGSVVAAEVDLFNLRLRGTEAQKASVLPLLREGDDREAFPPLLHDRSYADFRRESHYLTALFDLVLTIHGIRFDDPIVRDLRAKLLDEANHFAHSRGRDA